MEFYEVINKRRSIRQFEDKEIPREVLGRILDAGIESPVFQPPKTLGACNADG